MPFSVSNIKDKASSAKNASVSKFQNTRDKYSSTPMAESKFIGADGRAASAKSPPPPPPARPSASSASSSSTFSSPKSPAFARSPPPIVRSTKPSAAQAGVSMGQEEAAEADVESIDWANLSPADKQVFFSWLDEFFARFLNSPVKPRSAHDTVNRVYGDARSTPSQSTSFARGPPGNHKPPIAARSRPAEPSALIASMDDLQMSHPPQTTYGSMALDLAHYFHPDTTWDTAWYASQKPMPPPLVDTPTHQWAMGNSWVGTAKTMSGGVLFSDLSACWFRVEFSTAPHLQDNPANAQRHAEYVPPPTALPKDALVDAHETYGETVAAFAEGFVGTGEMCARGECWDLASEALKYFDAFDYVPKPIPSIHRTHGHLIFEGRGGLQQTGRWRGGDDRVRRGDIVEWRVVKINTVGAARGSYVHLGDPDHTAIIVQDAEPIRTPKDGDSLLPSDLVELVVVEQSVGQPPARKRYDMKAFEKGEMWIYRPISMQSYIGFIWGNKPPKDVITLTI